MAIVTAQRDVEGDDIRDLAGMDGAVAHRRPCDGETVQEGGVAFVRRAFEHAAIGRREES